MKHLFKVLALCCVACIWIACDSSKKAADVATPPVKNAAEEAPANEEADPTEEVAIPEVSDDEKLAAEPEAPENSDVNEDATEEEEEIEESGEDDANVGE